MWGWSAGRRLSPHSLQGGVGTLMPRCRRRQVSESVRCLSSPRVFEARLRSADECGTRQSIRLRLEDRIPGVVYGVGSEGRRSRLLVTCDRSALMKEIREHTRSIESIVYELRVDGGHEPELVTMRQIQVRTASEYVVSVNFLRFAKGRILEFPIAYANADKNIALKRGGYLHRTVDFVQCVVDTHDVPRHLRCDVREGAKNHVFRLADLEIPPGLTLRANNTDVPIAVVKLPRGAG